MAWITGPSMIEFIFITTREGDSAVWAAITRSISAMMPSRMWSGATSALR